MRSYWEEFEPATCARLDALLEIGVQEAHAHTVGRCARCRRKRDLTYLGLCPSCFKAAYDGQFVRTNDGRWVLTDIMFMRTVIQGPNKAYIKTLEEKLFAGGGIYCSGTGHACGPERHKLPPATEAQEQMLDAAESPGSGQEAANA